MAAISSHTDEWAPLPLEIPLHWEQIDFEDAFENISLARLKVSQKDYLSSGTIPIVDQGVNFIGGFTNDASKSIQSTRALIVFGDHTKCFKLVRFRFAPGADGIKVLKPVTIDERFAYYACRALRLPDRGYSRHYAFLKKSKIPLASQNEQLRIVAKIEELFSELDKGIESFKTAREQLTVYRQAVLKHAFEGRLTEEWRKKHAGDLESARTLLEKIKAEREQRYQQQLDDWKRAVEAWEVGSKEGKKPTKPGKPKELPPLTEKELSELPELPESWIWEKLSWMTLGVEYGTSAKSQEVGKVPVLRMGNIQQFRFDWSDLVFSDDEDEINKYCMKRGDVLFNRTNSPELVGKTAIFQGEQESIFAGYLIRVNQMPNIVDPKFLNYFLNSYVARNQSNKVKTDGVNQSNINGNKLIHYPFPYCSLNEQEEVVREIESRLSVAEKLEQDIEDGLKQAEALRQSLLKKAFEGRLVPQDPNDEPASVLLTRIKSEKAKLKRKARKEKTVAA